MTDLDDDDELDKIFNKLQKTKIWKKYIKEHPEYDEAEAMGFFSMNETLKNIDKYAIVFKTEEERDRLMYILEDLNYEFKSDDEDSRPTSIISFWNTMNPYFNRDILTEGVVYIKENNDLGWDKLEDFKPKNNVPVYYMTDIQSKDDLQAILEGDAIGFFSLKEGLYDDPTPEIEEEINRIVKDLKTFVKINKFDLTKPIL